MANQKKLVFKAVRSKYVIASVIFLVWIGFFDEHSFMVHNKNRERLKNLQKQEVNYKEKIRSDQQKIEELNAGMKELEKFAREEYQMSKPNEDLFIVEED